MMHSVLGFFAGLIVALSITLLAGESPMEVFGILLRSAFGSSYDLALSLSYTVPLIFTGLSVAVAFHAGLFNIGAEGQLLMAAAAAAAVGVLGPDVPLVVGAPAALLAALIVGGLWGLIPGWLRVRRGAHEVTVTIMLNFIAAGLTSWFILNVIPNPQSQNPESAFVKGGYYLRPIDPLSRVVPDSPLSSALVLALTLCFVVWIFLFHTKAGFELRATGSNGDAARRAGISTDKLKIVSMTLAGALASFVAFSEVLAGTGQFKIGFSPEYGFMGIAVALMARNNPLAIPVTAFLLGSLHKGASDLDLETENITRTFSQILQACIILGVTAHGIWEWVFRRRKT